jgi:hypothetical protein
VSRGPSSTDWRSGFTAAGLEEDAAPDFRHPRLGADEARLLSVFGHLRRGDVGAALLH